MKTLKPYVVTAHLYHESFGGCDHYDGKVTAVVEACNLDSAESKGRKLLNKKHRPRDVRVVSVENKNDATDWRSMYHE